MGILGHAFQPGFADERTYERRIERPVLGIHHTAVQFELETFVGDVADIDRRSGVDSRGRSHGNTAVDGVLDLAAEVVHAAVQATVEEGEVQTHVELFFDLPFHVAVLVVHQAVDGHPLTVVIGPRILGIHTVGRIGVKTLITRRTVAYAQLQVVHGPDVAHEFLRRNAPAGRDAGEKPPAVAVEFRRAFVTQVQRHEVAVVERIVHTAEEGDQAGRRAFVGTHTGFAVREVGSGAEIPRSQTVHLKVGVAGREVVAVELLERITEHGIEVVTAETAVVIGRQIEHLVHRL